MSVDKSNDWPRLDTFERDRKNLSGLFDILMMLFKIVKGAPDSLSDKFKLL